MEGTKLRSNSEENDIPGTTNILVGRDSSSFLSRDSLKRTKDGIALIPQPSDSCNDPLNWSPIRKGWHLLLLTLITGLTAAISNDAGAAQDSLNEVYGISYDAMNTGAGVLFLFIGWSCIFFAPASSLYGRRITYIICLFSGCLGSVWFAVSKDTSDTIWSQAFVGLSESCAEAQVQQSLSDIFFQHQLGSVLTIYIMATSIGSFLAPLIAHIISEAQKFRWVGWWGAIASGIVLIFVVFSCEETVYDRSLDIVEYNEDAEVSSDFAVAKDEAETSDERKKVKEENETSNIEFEFSKETETTDKEQQRNLEKPHSYWKRISLVTPSPFLRGTGFKQYVKLFLVYFKVFTLPAVWLSGILWGLQDAYMTFFLTTQDTYFSEDPWNYSETGVAILNVATLIGAILGCIMSGVISDKHILWLARKNEGISEAEHRLLLLFITLFISPLGLILFGVGAAKSWSPVAIYAGLGFIGFGWGSIGDTAMSYLMDAYPAIVIQGMVGVSIINNTLACIFTFVCSYWLDGAGTESTYIVLAVIDFVSICFIIPFLFFGKKWRLKTKKLYYELVELTRGHK